MLLSKTVEMKWNSRNVRRYSDLGYTYTFVGQSFEVKVEDLPQYCQSDVDVVCDYCGKTFQMKWASYLRGRRTGLDKDCCSDPACTGKKAADALEHRYGVRSCAHIPEVVQRRKETCVQRYGVENPFASEEIKEKIARTNLEKYGGRSSQQNKEVRAKAEKTCMERYGVKNYVELFAGKFIGENSPLWKGGVEYSRVERATYDYAAWRTRVFARDRYTCQCCGARNGNGTTVSLHAHHIKNWADNPDDRYDTDNGITMCKHCHMKFHSTYGKRHNTEEQLQEFLQTKRYAELAGTQPQEHRDKKLCG